MPRSLWNGTLSFGLVNVPVKLYSAVQDRTVHFHEVHLRDGGRIEHRRFCSKEDREVDYDEVVKGHEVAEGEYVVLEKEEVAAASGSRAHVVAVEHFVCAGDIDPVFLERPYFLGPGDDGEDAYRLLHDALERAGRAAVGSFTFHNRERVAVVLPRDGVLALHTLRYADEVIAGEDLELEPPGRAPADREVEMAGRLVETLHADWRPEDYEDEYRAAVMDVVRRKARGEDIEAPGDEDEGQDDDLLQALQASLDGEGRG